MPRFRQPAFLLLVTAMLAAMPAGAHAAKRIAGMGVGQCWIDGSSNPAGPGESISSCCLEDGCWICNSTWNDCVWDPKVGAKVRGQGTVGVVPGKQLLERGPTRKTSPANRTGAGMKAQ